MSEAVSKSVDDEWTKQEHAKLLNYCYRNKISLQEIKVKESRILPPAVALWRVKSKEQADDLWVIGGEMPGDHLSSSVAKSAREALRHFALSWQLKAENLRAIPQKTSQDFASLLVASAERLYVFANDDQYWK